MKIFICQYCSRETTNPGANKKHELGCNKNPNSRKVGGNKKGYVPWNKGKNAKEDPRLKHTEETKKKLSDLSKTNNPMFKEENRIKVSIGMKKAHKEGRAWNIGKSRWNNRPSYPETFFMSVIENEFIDTDYETEFPIGIYSADFCWPHLNKVIEIDGDQHQRFEEYKERDKRKDKFLDSEGYQVLRVAWKEMCNDTKDKIKECYEFIHSH